MEFRVGDRVVSTETDLPGLVEGEAGTVVKLRSGNTPVIEWDNYNRNRHDCDGIVSTGHGWYIYSTSMIRHEAPIDLGDLSDKVAMNISKFLFDT